VYVKADETVLPGGFQAVLMELLPRLVTLGGDEIGPSEFVATDDGVRLPLMLAVPVVGLEALTAVLGPSTELVGCAESAEGAVVTVETVGADGAEMGITMIPLEEDSGVGTDAIGEMFEEPTATPDVKVETESCVTTRLTPSVA
jgi:hypothetical protein